MITLEMIDKGLEYDIIKIEDTGEYPGIGKNGIPICRIGENWFYFAGMEGECCNGVNNYLLNHTREEVIMQIYETLLDFNQSRWGEYADEYSYYDWYLCEQLKRRGVLLNEKCTSSNADESSNKITNS